MYFYISQLWIGIIIGWVSIIAILIIIGAAPGWIKRLKQPKPPTLHRITPLDRSDRDGDEP